MFSLHHHREPIMSALKRFNLERDPNTKLLHPVLPKGFQVVHAIGDVSMRGRSADGAKDPYFLEGWDGFDFAMCGAKVKVVLPTRFNVGDKQACKKCVQAYAEHQEIKRKLTNSNMIANNYKPDVL